MNQQYKLSLQDLVELLKLEPKNSAAQKEMDSVKKLYKEVITFIDIKAVREEGVLCDPYLLINLFYI